jgi:hypothetical protein
LNTAEIKELIELLDNFFDVFRQIFGLCSLIEHTIPIADNVKSKRLRAYKVPENYRAEVIHQIKKLLSVVFLVPNNSS